MKKLAANLMIVSAMCFLSACLKEPPKCADKETLTLLRNIILDKLGGAGELDEKEIEENLKIEFPKVSVYDEKIKKYTCDANLIVGDTWEVPIQYWSQLNGNNQHLVGFNGFLSKDWLHMRMVLRSIKVEKLKKSASPDNPPSAQGSAPT